MSDLVDALCKISQDVGLQKTAAARDILLPAVTGGLGAALTLGGVLVAVGPKGRARMSGEIRDPRLYSNLRGMGTLESREERVEAHKKLRRGKHHTIGSAMREGFGRGGSTKKEAAAKDAQKYPAPGSGKEKKAAIKTAQAFLSELKELNALTEGQWEKLASEVTTPEAAKAFKRLKRLEASKPGAGEVGRGALVGAGAGPLATLAHRAISGSSAARPGGVWPGGRSMLASAGYGAVFGGLMPAARQKLEREVEKQKLREYLGTNRRGKLRSKIKKTVGI